MTPPKDQAPELVARLRDAGREASPRGELTWKAADMIERQSARIAELEGAVKASSEIGRILGFLGNDPARIAAFLELCGEDLLKEARHALLPKTRHDTPPHKGLIREQWKPEDEHGE